MEASCDENKRLFVPYMTAGVCQDICAEKTAFKSTAEMKYDFGNFAQIRKEAHLNHSSVDYPGEVFLQHHYPQKHNIKCNSSRCNKDCNTKFCAEGCTGTTCGTTCTADSCAVFCEARSCGSFCNNVSCAQQCVGQYCGKHCKGESCAKQCVGNYCGKNCEGVSCAEGCQGQSCGQGCTQSDCGKNCLGNNCGNPNSTGRQNMKQECGAYSMKAHCDYQNAENVESGSALQPCVWRPHTVV